MADGKTNPFGNGAGGMKGPLSMPIDFTKQPGGSRNATPTQTAYAVDSDVNAKDAAAGGRILKADPVQSPAKDIGVGTPGSSQKPFRLAGG